MQPTYRSACVWAVAMLAALLAGCAGPRIVDSEVSAFSTLGAVAPGSGYRFERLPSQQVPGTPQDQLEAMAVPALGRVGLVRNDAAPRFSVQIGARVQRFERGPWDDPFWPAWSMAQRDYIVTARGQVVVIPSFPQMAFNTPWYEREVSVVMRDLASNQIVYETRAHHEGRWSDSLTVLPAMFEAALRGFPTPPPGARRVDVEIAR